MLSKMKMGILSLFFAVSLFAQNFVLENQNQLITKTTDFMEILSSEVYEKTGISLYVVALEDLGTMNLEEKEQSYLNLVKSPYVLLFFSKKEKKINILASPQMEEIFDKKAVYWEYIVPLIPKSDDELTSQNISAFLLNGYVDITDRIADKYHITLEHSFPKQNEGVKTATRAILYVMLSVLLILFAFTYLRRKSE